MRRKGFFSMKIKTEWGGLGFSAYAVSRVLRVVQSRSPSAGATVAVPNSLGPGELLECYGTPAQRERYLPRLTNGELIPCFALTAPHSGSDAASMTESDGYVVKGEDGRLGIRCRCVRGGLGSQPPGGEGGGLAQGLGGWLCQPVAAPIGLSPLNLLL